MILLSLTLFTYCTTSGIFTSLFGNSPLIRSHMKEYHSLKNKVHSHNSKANRENRSIPNHMLTVERPKKERDCRKAKNSLYKMRRNVLKTTEKLADINRGVKRQHGRMNRMDMGKDDSSDDSSDSSLSSSDDRRGSKRDGKYGRRRRKSGRGYGGSSSGCSDSSRSSDSSSSSNSVTRKIDKVSHRFKDKARDVMKMRSAAKHLFGMK